MIAELVSFEPLANGAFKGIASVRFPDLGLIVHGIGVYQTVRHQRVVTWAHWPARCRRGPDGQKDLLPLIEAADEGWRGEYERAILAALDGVV